MSSLFLRVGAAWFEEPWIQLPAIAGIAPLLGLLATQGYNVLRNLALSRIYGVNEETVTDATAFLSPKTALLFQWWQSCVPDF